MKLLMMNSQSRINLSPSLGFMLLVAAERGLAPRNSKSRYLSECEPNLQLLTVMPKWLDPNDNC